MATCILSMLFANVMLLCSCSNENFANEITNIQAPHSDLKAFAQKHNALMDSLFATTDINRSEVELDTTKAEQIINNIENNFRIHTSIKNIPTRGAMEITTASELLNMAPDSIMPYIKENTSCEFYDIYSKTIETGIVPITEEDILNSTELSQEEKMSALLFVPVSKQNENLASQEHETVVNSNCLSRYKAARSGCAVTYIASCALSCTGGPIIATAGVALATYELNNCLDDALYHYRQCK